MTSQNYRININVSGKHFSAKLQSLRKYPNTLLGSEFLRLFYDHGKGEYFFDRDPELFRFILNYYRLGKLHISEIECPGALQDELDFFGIPNSALDECCIGLFTKVNQIENVHVPHCRHNIKKTLGNHGKNEKRTHTVIKMKNDAGARNNKHQIYTEKVVEKDDKLAKKVKNGDGNTRTRNSKLTLVCSHIKNTSDSGNNYKKSYLSQKILYVFKNKKIRAILQYLYGLMILGSSLCNTVETIDCYQDVKCGRHYVKTFFAVETFFVAVFSADYVIRLLLADNKLLFIKQVLNIVDLLAILPYYLELIFTVLVGASDVLITFRVLRVLRLMKLSRNSPRLQTLVLTLRNSFKDLLLLYFIFIFGILLFGGAIYYVESGGSNADKFTSIPHSLWFTCVTMVTTGYGDVVPVTIWGKIFASLCGFCGVLIMSLPIPIMQERKANQQS
ncbi:potassium voltage-gated channel subfamily D member 3-like [Exaiptasia diaphana]|uniref:BTB domain-containing protein n=1 Tax=Exaiptasia diaphana TaxID=2652724 RepID=A0A913XMJ8_EXADI|nr:potassium voltage-gated channel subfamily D member 3-like [Exaiptasia diaphana]